MYVPRRCAISHTPAELYHEPTLACDCELMCILPPVRVNEFFEVCTKLLGVPWGCEVEELSETCGPVGDVDK